MIELLAESNEDVAVIRMSGFISDDDFQKIPPEVRRFYPERLPTRALVDWQELQGWDEHGAEAAFAFRMMHAYDFERIAVIGTPGRESEAQELASLLKRGELRFFTPDQREAARDWLAEE